MQIKTIGIDKLVPYDKNPRRNEAAVATVVDSLREFGWQQPIVVDADMVVIAGHTRLLAARELGMQKVPVHIAAGLSKRKAQAYRLMDNRSAENADWIPELIKVELLDLQSDGFDLALTGFDESEIARALANGATAQVEELPVHAAGEAAHQCPSCGYRWTAGQDET